MSGKSLCRGTERDGVTGLEFAYLKDLAFDMELTGFDGREIDRLLAAGGSDKEDVVPDLPENPVSRLSSSISQSAQVGERFTRKRKALTGALVRSSHKITGTFRKGAFFRPLSASNGRLRPR